MFYIEINFGVPFDNFNFIYPTKLSRLFWLEHN